ncbi:MAG: hypothetical protein BGO59_09420 [Spirosoma sp. 48-14]|jgi:thiopeptide-type bacteriocin biosynthesis protein|nr:MAG: hypothetical protein BGO59_09420 [Spirosoma sp. 48-14]
MAKPKFGHHSFFGVRLPFRPINHLIDFLSLSRKQGVSDSRLLLKSLLEAVWSDEAIFLSSTNLLKSWNAAKDNILDIDPALELALWRYVFRWYGRSTPYGLFAGVAVGTIGEERIIRFDEAAWQTNSRPDSTIITEVGRTLAQDKLLRSLLNYSLNNSLYKVAGQFRFSEEIGEPSNSKIVLSSLAATPDLEKLVDYLKVHSSASYSELINLYGNDLREEVSEYIDTLIDNQFLFSNLSIPITGGDMATYLLELTNRVSFNSPLLDGLREAQTLLTDKQLTIEQLTRAQKLLDQVVAQTDFNLKDSDLSIQTDLFLFPDQLQLDNSTVSQIADQFNALVPILKIKQPSPIHDFCRRFKARYDKQEIDLLTALDSDVGIGFINDTLANYPILNEIPFSTSNPFFPPPTALDQFKETLYSRYLLNGKNEVELTDRDIIPFTEQIHQSELPPSWYLHGELFECKSTNKEDSQQTANWRFLLNPISASSSSFFFARFCDGHEGLKKSVEEMCHWEQDQYPNDILAEVVHLPPKPIRAGNVVKRPALRPFEIPYITPAGVSQENTILLSDLLVSVTDDERIHLRSKKTGQRVRPMLSTAHNISFGDEVYQFLAYVSKSENETLGWSWGTLSELPTLPRLVYRNLVITPAQWTIRKDALPSNSAPSVELLRTIYGLPRYVLFIEADNKLLLDLDFEPAQRILLHEVSKKQKILLKEWFGEKYNPWLINGDNQYVSELVIPIKTTTNQPLKKSYFFAKSLKSDIERNFIPGKDWLYLKIYAHENSCDEILVNSIQPLYQLFRQKNWGEKMFFIRYADPDNHIRVRFKASNKHYSDLLTACYEELSTYLKSGLIYRVQLDTYQREIERYKPNLIEYCESIFDADSQFILTMLAENDLLNIDRFKLAIQSNDTLLSDFGFSVEEKRVLCRHLQLSFFDEQGKTKEVKQKLNDLYREYSRDFFLLSDNNAIQIRSSKIKQAAIPILQYYDSNLSDTSFLTLVASILHMFMNRVFEGQHRKHEMVIYHFMARHYESVIARNKKTAQ